MRSHFVSMTLTVSSDLTQDALRERGLTVDTDGFDTAMEKQRAEARANWSGSGEEATETVWFDLRNAHGATEFVGYTATQAEGVVQAIRAEANWSTRRPPDSRLTSS